MKRAFTLIELLIVVAIIAILAAIAVPNFLEAQVRAKVGRVRADMRTIGTALEAYAVDYNGKFPIIRGYKILGHTQWDRGGIAATVDLTTPIAYLSSVNFLDPFCKFKQVFPYGLEDPKMSSSIINTSYHYINVPQGRFDEKRPPDPSRPAWFQLSLGPDYIKGPSPYAAPGYAWQMGDYMRSTLDPAKRFEGNNYDPSNGTISGGDIIRHQ